MNLLSPAAKVLAGAALLLALSGCERSVPRTDYFPLRDGNRWEYRLLDMPLLKRLDAGQAVETAPLDEFDAKRLAAPAEHEAPATLAPKSDVASTAAPGTVDRTPALAARRVVLDLREAVDDLTYRAVYDTAEQVWSKRNGYVGFQSSRGRNYLLILPPHTGYKWVVTASGGKDLFYEIENAFGTVTTPAGTFQNCAVARQESWDRKEIFRYWFAPDVGMVRRSKYVLKTEVFRQELVAYTVHPATPGTRMAEDREVRHATDKKDRGSEFRKSGKGEPELIEPIEVPDTRLNESIRNYVGPR